MFQILFTKTVWKTLVFKSKRKLTLFAFRKFFAIIFYDIFSTWSKNQSVQVSSKNLYLKVCQKPIEIKVNI